MKKILCILISISLLLGLSGCGRKNKDKPVVHTVRIGVLEPLTGSAATVGRRELLGVRYANSLVSSLTMNGETYEIELLTADCGSTVDSARQAAEALAGQGVSVVIGTSDSELSLAVGEVFEENGIAVIGAGCSDDGITAKGNYYFRLCATDSQEMAVLADFAIERYGGGTAYVVSVDDEEGRTLADRFRLAFEARGGSVFYDTVRPGTTDFAPYLERAKSAGASVVYLALNATYAVRAVSQAGAVSFELPILGSHLIDDPRVPIAAGEESATRIYCAAYCRVQEESSFVTGLREFLDSDEEAIQQNGGTYEVSTITALGYDAYHVALEAIRSAGSADKADILARLPAVIWRGVSGLISFDDSGNAKWERIWLRKADVKEGSWVMDSSREIPAG